MINLPKNYKTRMINRYGQEGKEWLNNIDNIIEKYKNKFELENIRIIDKLSINVVLFAKSHKYGDIVVKIGPPCKTIISEINIIKHYSPKYFPKCYDSSVEDRVIVLERLFPGDNLTTVKDLNERTKIFANIADNLLNPIENVSNTKEFLTFNHIFKEKIKYAYQNKKKFESILWMIEKANNIYDKIYKMNLPKYILHNDLHHKNILKSEEGWKVIDPHGIIGERVIECLQFIRSELDNINLDIDNEFDKIITLVSKSYKEDKTLILETLYIYTIDKIIFYTKNKEKSNRILHNIHICEKILQQLNAYDK